MSIHPTALIGNRPETREHLRGETTDPQYVPIVDYTAHVGPLVTVDSGTKRPTLVGEDAILLAHSHIGHDAHVGDRAEVSTGAIIGGHAEVGEDARIGLGAVILPFRKIGPGAVIGAGAVVTKDVPAGETWVGNPAGKLEDAERDPRPHSERTNGLLPGSTYIVGRCGNCNEVTDRLPCPHCTDDSMRGTWEQMFTQRHTG